MVATEKTQILANGSIYASVTITGNKNIYSFTKVSGAINYVSVLKESNNPFKTLGKQFPDFDTAQMAYKLPELKTMLLLAETIL